MSLIEDFKKFMIRGSVVDMAIGIILGASFTKVVDALVNNILMPPLSFLIGEIDFSHLKITLRNSSEKSSEIAVNIGLFINSILSFFIVGFSIFLLIKILNRFHMKTTIFTKKRCPECKMEIPIEALRCPYCTVIFEN